MAMGKNNEGTAMFFTIRRGIIAATLLALIAPAAVSAQEFDCAAYENYAGAEPEGYAEACIESGPAGPSAAGGAGDAPNAPTDTAFAHDIGFISDNTIEHQQGDLSASVIVGASADAIFGYDYSPDLSTLYAIDNNSGMLGTSDGTTFTPIGAPTNPGGHTWTGLAINGATGEAFLSSTDGGTSVLQSVDLATGNSAVIGNITGLGLVIEIAINCDGEMYAHDIGTDSIYTIDTGNGSPTLVGPTGINANFAQGMDFDNESGELYIHGYTGGGTNTYGTVDLGNGSITPLNVDNPLGEFEGASQTSCGDPTGPARFQVTKDFDDDNTAEVDVVISCNTGLPLTQSTSISEGDDVTFVVGDFADGAMDCQITETVPGGYTASYSYGDDQPVISPTLLIRLTLKSPRYGLTRTSSSTPSTMRKRTGSAKT
jgi:hypothetical protein